MRVLCISMLLMVLSGLQTAVPADLTWLQTARVLLLDAYQYPFAPALEFDAELIAQTAADLNANVIRMSTMGKYATIQGVRFPVHRDQGNRDLLAEMIAACKPRGINVVPYISTGHKLAWSTVTEYYPEYAHVSTPGGGPVRNHFFVGEDHGTVCWNTPYRQAYLELVEHVVRDYDVAGMYFDTWRPHYFWEGPLCYCDGCKTGFRKISGKELPWHENDKDYTDEERALIRRYQAWYREELMGVMKEVRRIIKSHKDVPLIYNPANPQKITREDPRVLETMDGFLYERSHSILERAEGVSLARSTGMYVWPYIGVYHNWPRLVVSGLDYQQEIFTNAMFGGGSIIAQPTGYLTVPESRNNTRYPFGVIARQPQYYQGFENVPHVVVIYALESPRDHSKNGWFWDTDVRIATRGAFAACLYNHIQVSSALETLLDHPDRLAKYRVLYLADIPYLSPERITNIRRFVEQGGSLIAGYATSLYDAQGQRQNRFALEDLIGVQPDVGNAALEKEMAVYEVILGGPNDLYLRGREDIPGGFGSNRLTPAWQYEPVRMLQGGTTLVDIVRGDGMRPLLPAVVESRIGQGRVLYLASSLESLFDQSNIREAGDFLEWLITRAAGERHPYTVDGPDALIANMTVKEQYRILHLTNWTGNKLERNSMQEYYLAPIENIRVEVFKPAGKTLRYKQSLVEGVVKHRDLGDRLEFVIPRMEAYQGIVMTVE